MFEIGSTWHKWDLHVHTSMSYDSQYKAEDSNEKFVEAWHDNDISVVAITDHECIDPVCINNIREIIYSKGYEITVFPGVEFKTDTASPNVHVIGIFSEKTDLTNLAEDFRTFARLHDITPDADSNYASLNDIQKFVCDQHHGLISVHDGRKSNGLGQAHGLNGSKNDPNKELKRVLRHDFRKSVDFLDTNTESSAENLIEHTCVGDLKGLPVTVNSDVHSPMMYDDAQSVTWIKAELTFDGLKEAFSQPRGRISFGVQPPSLSSQSLRKHQTISQIEIQSDAEQAEWYGKSLKIKLNPGLVTIIGNKGAGKSALSDVIGLDGSSRNMDDASFLSKKRFNNSAKYGSKFSSRLIWADGDEGNWIKLDASSNPNNARVDYLPQSFIEKIASAVDDSELNNEIDKIIFGALPVNKRMQQKSWQSLVDKLDSTSDSQISDLRTSLTNLNKEILELENKFKPDYIEQKMAKLTDIESQIKSLRNNPPKEVNVVADNTKEQNEWKDLNKLVGEERKKITQLESDQAYLEKFLLELNELKEERKKTEKIIHSFNTSVDEFTETYRSSLPDALDVESLGKIFIIPEDHLNSKDPVILAQTKNTDEKFVELKAEIESVKDTIEKKKKRMTSLKSKMTKQDKEQAKYIEDLAEWEKKLKTLEDGNGEDSEVSKQTLTAAISEFNNDFPKALSQKYKDRNVITEKIIALLKIKGTKLDELYQDAKNDIATLNNVDQQQDDANEAGVEFISGIEATTDYYQQIVAQVDSRKAGKLRGSVGAHTFLTGKMDSTILDDPASVILFIEDVVYQTSGQSIIDEKPNFEALDGVFFDKQRIYDYLYGLEFLDVRLRLTYNNRSLQELSAGEKGLVLLIFYLGLSQKNSPLVIDQPEDNLDNQSIFKHLVPYLRYAKNKRQIIVVTHNPNIAIAADAEQVIVANMDKSSNTFNFVSGALENKEINQKVIDVLEGTKPAFELRDRKYSLFS
ncbi:hypothetical protein (plasmid) [Lactobacillus alimentarius DSM 20249] [Lactiplantibacillus mudanjiangensis]|uniref:TrlF family AAA-like ATPase n=1 Tax=Lactiplantibacillus mudanjiangensis TaxID=1296538 RepID=UPI001014E2C8|nr:AAA family ATPase [Lactiplantibacillus mudanjiangensis]VDG30776.1 hypothetical protein (plasmid) [Lactobacillus alimentarius DSM 20249] [Lactiplantibacillus mudanjiangensis]